MKSERRAANSTAPHVVRYAGADYVGPASIYKATKSATAVSLATFSARFRRLVERNALSDVNIAEALALSADEFKRKYGARRTLAELDGLKIDLLAYYTAHATDATVDYRNFWQRIRASLQDEDLSHVILIHALTLPTDDWRIFYGGGRRKDFIYEGDEYPDQSGKRFHSVAAFLRTVGRYDDRDLIWSRLKACWNLDYALAIPVTNVSHRAGSIYRVMRRKTNAVYVGLTVTTVKQRWAFHVRSAMAGSKTKLHAAIRADGADGFDVDVLEDGIKDTALLPLREAFWVERLSALGPNGLNSAKPGGLGSPGGKAVRHGDEAFRSIEEAAEVLSMRLGIARHVARTRLQKEMPLPAPDRVRRHSRHPEAGSNLFRRWLGMRKRHAGAVVGAWADYDQFKADVSPVPADMELIRKRTDDPWGPGNIEWVSVQTKVERTHGKALEVHGVVFPSLSAVAKAYGIGTSTLKNRLAQQGMSVEQAIDMPLAVTSYKNAIDPITVDGRQFRSKRQAILYIAETRGLKEHQAKYRFTTGKY
jgi:hypothetical protein